MKGPVSVGGVRGSRHSELENRFTHFWDNFKCEMGDNTEIVFPYFRIVLSPHFGLGICQKLVHVGLLTLCAPTDTLCYLTH